MVWAPILRMSVLLPACLMVCATPTSVNAEVPGADRRDREGKVGLGMNLVGALGPFNGGLTVAGYLGWSPTPRTRLLLSGEHVVIQGATVACDCAGPGTCCVGANASYAWLGVGGEAHATPGNRGDVYVSAEIGAIGRNTWRPAAKAGIGFELKLGRVTVGPALGLVCTPPDSLFDEHESIYSSWYAGLRLVVAFDRE